MIQLKPDCLIFQTSDGDQIPCSAEWNSLFCVHREFMRKPLESGGFLRRFWRKSAEKCTIPCFFPWLQGIRLIVRAA